MTTGQFVYTAEGKIAKVFGPDDADALKTLSNFLSIRFFTADIRGFDITHRRICEDMGFELTVLPSIERYEWITANMKPTETAYMGDSYLDFYALRHVKLGIAPSNAHPLAKKAASVVTKSRGGEGAVAEACFLIAKKHRIKKSEFFS